jgi:UDP-2,3-diacylglucosamine hydrolase
MSLKIDENAIFIADTHYNNLRIDFEFFLDDIISSKIHTSQLFLMGDMFDFLSEEINYFKKINYKIIEKINYISKTIEIIYIEGNHDFNLKSIFSNTNVIVRNEQIKRKYTLNNRNLIITHGDIFTPYSYNIFTKIVRNTFIQKLLNIIDIGNFISKKFEKFLINKNICHKFEDFNSFAEQRLDEYNIIDETIVIEGHYHQGKQYKNYINIPSFACGNSYMQVINNKFEKIQYKKEKNVK